MLSSDYQVSVQNLEKLLQGLKQIIFDLTTYESFIKSSSIGSVA